MNFLGAKIQLGTLSIASVPVVLNASGGFVSLRRKEPGKASGLLTYDDFTGFKYSTEKVKEVSIASETLRGRAPKNPFGSIRAILTTLPGSVVVSSEVRANDSKDLLRNQTDASLNPSGKMHLTLSEGALDALKKQNQGIDSAGTEVEANLITVLGFTSMDPNQEIETLNMSLASQTGWIDKLLRLPEPQSVKPKKVKKTKQKKGKIEPPQPDPIDDVSADDWGTSSGGSGSKPSSGGSDWETSSGGSGSKPNSGGSDWGTSSGGSDWGSTNGKPSTNSDDW